MNELRRVFLPLWLLASMGPLSAQEVKPDAPKTKMSLEDLQKPGVAPQRPEQPYLPAKELEGEIKIFGSTALSQVVSLWSDGYAKLHPKVKFAFQFEGSETSMEKLVPGQPVLAAMSRPLLQSEAAAWRQKHRTDLLAVAVCEDVLVIAVNKANPLTSLTPAQAQMLFDARSGPAKWGTMGLTGEWASRPITIHGRKPASGSRTMIAQRLAPGGEERPQEVHLDYGKVRDAVSKDVGAVGYLRAATVDDSVKILTMGTVLIQGDDLIFGADYPLRRKLYLVYAKPTSGEIPTLITDYFRYVLSPQAQLEPIKDGFNPLGRQALVEELTKLGVPLIR